MRAYRQVVSNKGSAGVDGMPVKELYKYVTNNRERIESPSNLRWSLKITVTASGQTATHSKQF